MKVKHSKTKKNRLDIELEVLKNAMLLCGLTNEQLEYLDTRIKMLKVAVNSLPLQIKDQILS